MVRFVMVQFSLWMEMTCSRVSMTSCGARIRLVAQRGHFSPVSGRRVVMVCRLSFRFGGLCWAPAYVRVWWCVVVCVSGVFCGYVSRDDAASSTQGVVSGAASAVPRLDSAIATSGIDAVACLIAMQDWTDDQPISRRNHIRVRLQYVRFWVYVPY